MGKIKSIFAKNYFLIIVFLILLNFIFIGFFIYDIKDDQELNEKITKNQQNFDLLSPSIAKLNVDDFLLLQQTYTISYSNLKSRITNILKDKNGNFGVFMEDLTTGAWFGINEKEKFYPASLLKVPTLVAILKKIEKGELNLTEQLTLVEKDLNSESGSLFLKGTGYNITVINLLNYIVNESDNTAAHALQRKLSYDELMESVLGMGLPPLNESSKEPLVLSPKEYSNIFRSLYYSTYLRRPFSQMALTLMSDTIYNTQIKAGLPEKIKFSHKVGIWAPEGYFHDCGIVYLPNKNYLICIMSKKVSREESNYYMKLISEEIYNYMLGTISK